MSRPAYRVRVSLELTVIDEDDQSLRNALVLEIRFPNGKVETGQGLLNTLVGPGVAKAKVVGGDQTIRGMPLC